MKFIGFVLLIIPLVFGSNADEAKIYFGVFADCQYCDCDTKGSRYYRNSTVKLDECVNFFNQKDDLEFLINLGDLIDRDVKSFEPLKPILNQSEKPVFHVLGNHDYTVEKKKLKQVYKTLNLKKLYYSFEKKGWKFIFLNGNDISFFSGNADVDKLAEEMTAKLKSEGKPNYHNYNGGLGDKQMKWLESQLQEAEKDNVKLAIFCHYPLLPLEAHTLWNQEEVLELITKYSSVKLWMNGHNHAGNYAFFEGIHFVNLKGMVETDTSNSFAEVILSDEIIEIVGHGREINRKLKI